MMRRFGRLPEHLSQQLRARPPRGLFVTATDTEVGKTVIASAIAATLAASGRRVSVFKPAVTGLDEPTGAPPDHELLRVSARSLQHPEQIAPYRFGPAVSPHLAAELAGVRIEPARLVECALRASEAGDCLIAEGVGGLNVPLAADYLVRDLAADLGLPLVVVARAGLGTINHTLLTLEGARSAGLEVAAVVLTRWPEEPSAMERSNLETIEAIGGAEVTTLGDVYTGPPINAVCELPLERWLSRPVAPLPQPAAA